MLKVTHYHLLIGKYEVNGTKCVFQAVANESGINFISVKGPELLNMVRDYKSISSGVKLCLFINRLRIFVFKAYRIKDPGIAGM